jgi:hypothetical protein
MPGRPGKRNKIILDKTDAGTIVNITVPSELRYKTFGIEKIN